MVKLTLILDPAPEGLLASLVEEWDSPGGPARMAPRIRHFDTEDAAFVWGRSLARRRGLARLYLTDNRKAVPR